MGIVPDHGSDQRTRLDGAAEATRYVPNPACHFTDQGADPNPGDLSWCICREWRVIYYSAHCAAGLPLWEGVDEFELLMIDVLLRLSSGHEPIAPLDRRAQARPADGPSDWRRDRVRQLSCRIFRTPVFRRRKRLD